MERETKFCPNCGSLVESTTNFCQTCGYKIRSQESNEGNNGLLIPQNSNTESLQPIEDTNQKYLLDDSRPPPIINKGFFNMDNLFRGIWRQITSTYKDAIIIYSVYVLLAIIPAYFISQSLSDAIYSLELPNVDEGTIGVAALIDKQLLLTFLLSIISSLFINTFRPLADLPFYYRLDNFEKNKHEPWGVSLRNGYQRFVPFISAQILLFLIKMGVMLGIVILGALLVVLIVYVSYFFAIGMIIIFLGSFVASFYLEVKLSITIPLVVIDRESPMDAIRKSWNLVNGNKVNILILLLALGFTSGVVSSAASYATFPLMAFNPFIGMISATFLQFLIYLPVKIWFASSLLYYIKLYHGQTDTSRSFVRAMYLFEDRTNSNAYRTSS